MIKLVVFDWNGTLIADVKADLDATNHELKFLGISPITVVKQRKFFEVPIRNYYKNLGVSEDLISKDSEKLANIYHTYYERRVDHCRTRGGARELLYRLEHKGIARIILSNHNVVNISRQLLRLKLTQHFDVILANETLSAVYHQGKQDHLREWLKTTDLKGPEIIIIGDTAEEIAIGQKLGLVTVALTGGYSSAKRLLEAKPDFIINKLSALEEVIHKYNKAAKLKDRGGK